MINMFDKTIEKILLAQMPQIEANISKALEEKFANTIEVIKLSQSQESSETLKKLQTEVEAHQKFIESIPEPDSLVTCDNIEAQFDNFDLLTTDNIKDHIDINDFDVLTSDTFTPSDFDLVTSDDLGDKVSEDDIEGIVLSTLKESEEVREVISQILIEALGKLLKAPSA